MYDGSHGYQGILTKVPRFVNEAGSLECLIPPAIDQLHESLRVIAEQKFGVPAAVDDRQPLRLARRVKQPLAVLMSDDRISGSVHEQCWHR